MRMPTPKITLVKEREEHPSNLWSSTALQGATWTSHRAEVLKMMMQILIKIFPYHKRAHVDPLEKGVGVWEREEVSGFTKAIKSNHYRNIPEIKKRQSRTEIKD